LPAKVVIDWDRVEWTGVRRFAGGEGIGGSAAGDAQAGEAVTTLDAPSPGPSRGEGSGAATELDHDAWLEWLRATPRERWPEWVTISQLEIVPFYDRTELIYETLG